MHLDLCALLSQKGDHNRALEHAENAVECVQEGIKSTRGKRQLRRRHEALAIAQHNVAVELEHLSRMAEAVEAYREAATTAAQSLGGDDPVSLALAQAHRAARYSLGSQTADAWSGAASAGPSSTKKKKKKKTSTMSKKSKGLSQSVGSRAMGYY